MKKGVVIKSVGSSYFVLGDDSVRYECVLKGNFKIKGLSSTNPVAVGDKVHFIMPDIDQLGQITHIEDRSNYIVRKSTKLSKKQHIIASNIEQMIVVATLASPRTSSGFIDRLLVSAEQYHIPSVIVFNKIDLLTPLQMEELQEFQQVYENLGYTTLLTSVTQNIGITEFAELLKNKVSLFTGHSGVGKSALVNTIQPSLNLRLGNISEYHLKGKHTTTFAEMHALQMGGFIIDTPGIKEFGMIHIKPAELAGYFPELRKLLPLCKFHNCSHIHEPGCAVIKAVEDGEINAARYKNYLNMQNDEGMKEVFD